VHLPLSRRLRAALDARAAEHGGLGTVVDVGCGVKPYVPWLDGRAARYVGLDLGPGADVVAATEALPLRDGCADVVLCTQVLEHVDDPRATVAELARVLRPGGLALVSTHGVRPYHPTPGDYWRWTAAGLEKLFAEAGRFARVEVVPCGGTIACLGSLVALYLALVGDRARRRLGAGGSVVAAAAGVAVAAVNLVARAADSRWPRQADPARANTMSANYLVVATR
jgi:SAM-dependent methyltransferase